MSGIWGAIIRQTSQSPAKLALFGVLTIGATAVLGSIFSSMTAAPQSPQELKRSLESMPFDSQRMAQAQQQRLSSMLKDMVENEGSDQHWKAVMRGTLVPHPQAENKTQGVDNERAARQAPR